MGPANTVQNYESNALVVFPEEGLIYARFVENYDLWLCIKRNDECSLIYWESLDSWVSFPALSGRL